MSHRIAPKLGSLLLFIFAIGLAAPVVLAGTDTPPFVDYRTESWFLPQSSSVTGGPAASFFNPAAWALNDRSATDFWWNDGNIRDGLDNYGLATGHNLGFAVNTATFGTRDQSWKVYDYQLGLAGGNRAGSFGVSYRWAHGETSRTPRQKALSAGFISRRGRFASFGAAGLLSVESKAAQYVMDLGLRPLGRDWLTLFADWTVNNDQAFFNGGTWGAGVEIRPVRGLHLGFRAREQVGGDDIDYSVIAGLTLNSFNATVMPRYNQDGDLGATSYLLRVNPPFGGLPVKKPLIARSSRYYYPINLEKRVLTYQNYRYFDRTRVAWLDLLDLLDRLRDEDRIKGVVINLAGFRGRPSLIWEFRQKLLELQAAGKEIIIHADRLNSSTYYLASVADHLSLDPWGGVNLPGLSLSRSYLKGTLEKLGIGFQEHRYFKYKSAVETLSRDSMSDADREQRQRIVDVIYEQLREDISAGRDLPDGRYDQIVDELAQLTASEALEQGLVDALGRWDGMPRWLKEQRRARLAGAGFLPEKRDHFDEVWGPTVKIPVVYAVGSCDMDTGIKGRATSAYLRSLVKDPTVAAVVLRADSPGGDPLPSDLVADAVRQLRKAGKPVIVSQGDVAASGGYWISMDGSRILTTPLTITGSIGVISGWIWDDGLGEKMGITADAVSRGKHADLYSQIGIPFAQSMPRRPMNEGELERTEKVIRDMYDQFIKAVATGRGLSEEKVGEIAQGRVWMGGDAVERGLCDGFGTLGDAIELARTQARVPDWRRVEVVEYPPRPLFEMPNLLGGISSPFGLSLGLLNRLTTAAVAAATSAEAPAEATVELVPGLDGLDSDYVRRISLTPGGPLLVLPVELLPEGWKDLD
jgi:protease-4